MKTKTDTKKRSQERQEVAAMKNLKKEFAREFSDVLDDSSIIDEIAMPEIDDYDD